MMNRAVSRAVARAVASSSAATARSARAVLVVPATVSAARAAPRRGLASATTATAAGAAKKVPGIACRQCEQAAPAPAGSEAGAGAGCRTIGVCGKTRETAALQDLIVHQCIGIATWAAAASRAGAPAPASVTDFVVEAMFSTLTNVNFDDARMVSYLRRGDEVMQEARRAAERAGAAAPPAGSAAHFRPAAGGAAALEAQAASEAGVTVPSRVAQLGADLAGAKEMCIFGLKGAMAYYEHAVTAAGGRHDEGVSRDLMQALADAGAVADVGAALGLALRIGEINLRVMALLDGAHTSRYGHPEPTEIPKSLRPGRAILVTGHDLVDLENILKATAGKGINVYCHGELTSAASYPQLKKYPHLAGNFGGAWQNQAGPVGDFARWAKLGGGAIVATSNCIQKPHRSYEKLFFTHKFVGFPGVAHVEGDDWSAVVEATLATRGVSEADAELSSRAGTVLAGFGHHTIMSVADKVVAGVQAGQISSFFVIGGCDGTEGERSYFTDLARATPKDSIILGLGCGRFRVPRDLGTVAGLPRVLDLGQCNDAMSAINVAVALSKALKTEINDLPLYYGISWLEQKAVAVLLTMLHLNLRRIHLGPSLPAFLTPNLLNVLVEKFDIRPAGNAAEDMARMVAHK